MTLPLGQALKENNKEVFVPALVTTQISKCNLCHGKFTMSYNLIKFFSIFTLKLGGPIWNKRIIDWEFTKKLIKNFFEAKPNQNNLTTQNQIILQTKLKIESNLYALMKVREIF